MKEGVLLFVGIQTPERMVCVTRGPRASCQQLFNNGEALGSDAVSGLNGNGVHAGSHLVGVDGEAFCVNVVVLVNNLAHHVNNGYLFDSSVGNDVSNGGSGVGEYGAGHAGAYFVDANIGGVEVLGHSNIVNLAVGRIAAVVVVNESNETGAPSFVVGGHGPGVVAAVGVASVGGSDSVAIESAEGSTVNVVVLVVGGTAALRSDDAVFYEVEGNACAGHVSAEGTGDGSGNGAGSFVESYVGDVNGNESGNAESFVDAVSYITAGEEDGALVVAEAEVGAVEHGSGSIGAAVYAGVVEPAEGLVVVGGHNVGVVTSVVAHPNYVRTGSESSVNAVVAGRTVGATGGGEVLEEGGTSYGVGSVVDGDVDGSHVVGGVVSHAVRIAYHYVYGVSAASSEVAGNGVGEVVGAANGDVAAYGVVCYVCAAVDVIGNNIGGDSVESVVVNSTANVEVGVLGNEASTSGSSGEAELVGGRNANNYIVEESVVSVLGIELESDVDALAAISGEVDAVLVVAGVGKGGYIEDSVGEVSLGVAGGGNQNSQALNIAGAVAVCVEHKAVVSGVEVDLRSHEPTVNALGGATGNVRDSNSYMVAGESGNVPSVTERGVAGVVGETITVGYPTGGKSTNTSAAVNAAALKILREKVLSRHHTCQAESN